MINNLIDTTTFFVLSHGFVCLFLLMWYFVRLKFYIFLKVNDKWPALPKKPPLHCTVYSTCVIKKMIIFLGLSCQQAHSCMSAGLLSGKLRIQTPAEPLSRVFKITLAVI